LLLQSQFKLLNFLILAGFYLTLVLIGHSKLRFDRINSRIKNLDFSILKSTGFLDLDNFLGMFLDRVIALDLVLHLEEFCEPFFGLLESSYLLLRRIVILVLVLDEFHDHVFLEQNHHKD